MPRRPDEPSPWWPEDVSAPNRDPHTPPVPARYQGLEPPAGRDHDEHGWWLGVPTKVWVSLVLGYKGPWVTAILTLPLSGLPLPSWTGLILSLLTQVAGLVLGVKGLTEVRPSNGLGKTVAITAIAFNGWRLVFIALAYSRTPSIVPLGFGSTLGA
jgi:hypothetical protein